MTSPRALPRSRLANLIPALLDGKWMVAIVPAPSERRWVAAAAWDVARAAARSGGGRRVALVDLSFGAPCLHEVVGLTADAGIAEAFASGGELTQAAHEVDGVFFIGPGRAAGAADADGLLGHERWMKLQRGFRSEDAVLLLFVSAPDLCRMEALPDGILVLSPDGLESGSALGLRPVLERGAPLLGVVRERWTPGPAEPVQDRVISGRHRSAVRLVAVATLLVAVAGGWQLLAKDADHKRAVPVPAVRFDPTPPANSAPPRPLTPPRTDTLAWTIQVAAFGGLPAALDLADQLTSSGAAAFVTPVSSGRGTIWYRVLAGFYRTRDAAAAARNGLWARGALKRGEGDLLLAPYSLALAPTTDIAALRALGVPAVRLPANGPPLVGAFESPEQATLAETRLQRAGVRTTLVTRTETTP